MKIFTALLFAVAAFAVATRAAETEVSLLETNVLRVRVNQFTENFADQLRAATPTNALIGNILDLRATDGGDGATAATADYFAAKKLPLVILVDAQTAGAAAALAKTLRAAGAGVVIGSAGGGLQPDIAVNISAHDEKIFLQNPYAVTAPNPTLAFSTNNQLLPYVDHTSEAELVRRHVKDGEDEGDATNSPRPEPPQPVLRDPALARALDLLKALAIRPPARG